MRAGRRTDETAVRGPMGAAVERRVAGLAAAGGFRGRRVDEMARQAGDATAVGGRDQAVVVVIVARETRMAAAMTPAGMTFRGMASFRRMNGPEAVMMPDAALGAGPMAVAKPRRRSRGIRSNETRHGEGNAHNRLFDRQRSSHPCCFGKPFPYRLFTEIGSLDDEFFLTQTKNSIAAKIRHTTLQPYFCRPANT